MRLLCRYKVRLAVGGQEFYGEGELPQQAKHDAGESDVKLLRYLLL